MCLGHKESGGKRCGDPRGNPAVRRALGEAARAAAKTRNNRGAQFHGWAARRWRA
jgi:hypothetical protein